MQGISELVDVLNQYYNNLLNPTHFWENSIFQALLLLIQVIVIICSAFGALWKYVRTKNISLYEKILAEVYAPLYGRIIRQEYMRKIYLANGNLKLKDVPILVEQTKKRNTKINSNSIKQTEEILKSPLLCEDNFLEVLVNTNFGLAPRRLVELINMYQMASSIQNNKQDESNEYLKNSILKCKIEYELVQEIVVGYDIYCKKLGLEKKHKSYINYDKSKDKIDINIENTEEEIINLRKNIEDNPEAYK